jgi:NADPH2:quinone reductase
VYWRSYALATKPGFHSWQFDVIVYRSRPGPHREPATARPGRLRPVDNVGGDSLHCVDGNAVWQGNFIVAVFNAGGYLPAHPEAVATAARTAAASGLADTQIELLPLPDAATAHERLKDHTAQGRIILVVP